MAGLHKKDLSAKNLQRGFYEKAPLTQYVRQNWHKEAQFKENT